MTEPPAQGLPQGAGEVWWWPVDGPAPPSARRLLDEDERRRAARLAPAAGERFVICRAAVRTVLGRLLGVPADEVRLGRRPCPDCADPDHGPPAVAAPGAELWIGISHARDCGLLAVARNPVGVDVEAVRRTSADRLAAAVLAPAERQHLAPLAPGEDGPGPRDRAFLRCWTRKEAVLKAVGVGLGSDLSRIDTRPWLADRAEVSTGLGVDAVPAWAVVDLPLGERWVASAAFPATVPGTVRLHRFEG